MDGQPTKLAAYFTPATVSRTKSGHIRLYLNQNHQLSVNRDNTRNFQYQQLIRCEKQTKQNQTCWQKYDPVFHTSMIQRFTACIQTNLPSRATTNIASQTSRTCNVFNHVISHVVLYGDRRRVETKHETKQNSRLLTRLRHQLDSQSTRIINSLWTTQLIPINVTNQWKREMSEAATASEHEQSQRLKHEHEQDSGPQTCHKLS